MVDLDANVDTMTIEELLEYQQTLSRERLAVLEKGRQVQAALDARAAEIAARQAEDAARLGQVSKPPRQELFGHDEKGES